MGTFFLSQSFRKLCRKSDGTERLQETGTAEYKRSIPMAGLDAAILKRKFETKR